MGKRDRRWPDGVRVLDEPGYGSSEPAGSGLQAGSITVQQAPRETRDRRRSLVPDRNPIAARPGRTTEVYLRAADGLTRPAVR
jgi:hypothetical protein